MKCNLQRLSAADGGQRLQPQPQGTAQPGGDQQQGTTAYLVLLGGQLLGHVSLDPAQHKGLQDALHALRQGVLRILTMQCMLIMRAATESISTTGLDSVMLKAPAKGPCTTAQTAAANPCMHCVGSMLQLSSFTIKR